MSGPLAATADAPDLSGVPLYQVPVIRRRLGADEQLVWAGRPDMWLFRRQLAIGALFTAAVVTTALVLARQVWLPLGMFAITPLVAAAGAPQLALTVHLTWYALTTRRVILHQPRLWGLWSVDRVFGPERVGDMKACGSAVLWFPPKSGGIGIGVAEMHSMSDAEAVAELIRATLTPPAGIPDPSPPTH